MEVYRGDIFYITGSGGKINGSEQRQDRPAVVVSNDKANEHSPVIEVVFLTTAEKAKYLPTHVDVMCQVPSIALCEQVNSISKTRLGVYIRTCSDYEMKMIDAALMVSLALSEESAIADNSAEIEHLKKLNKELQCRLQEETEATDLLIAERDELQKQVDLLEEKNKESSGEDIAKTSIELGRIIAERDVYKQQYETLLDRMLKK